MTQPRIPFEDNFLVQTNTDGALHAIQGAKVYAFLDDGTTNYLIDPPSGTALTGVFDAIRGGSPVTFPLTTDNAGNYKFYLTNPVPIIIVFTDNNHTAFIPGLGVLAPFPAVPKYVQLAPHTSDLVGFATGAPTAGTYTPDGSLGRAFRVSNDANFTMGAPTNWVAGQNYRIYVKNTHVSNAIVVTWNAAFDLATPWTNPAPGTARWIDFFWTGTVAEETDRSGGDIT